MKLRRLVIVISVVAALVAVTIPIGVFLYTWNHMHDSFNQRTPACEDETPAEYGLTPIDVSFESEDGIDLKGWYFEAENPQAVVITVHGTGRPDGGKCSMLGYDKFLLDAGYDVLTFDMRSYGESSGDKLSMGVEEWKDVKAAYLYVKDMPRNENREVGILGHSLGASTTINAAGKAQAGDFVIATAPYARVTDVFAFDIRRNNLPVALFMPFAKLAVRFELGFDYTETEPAALIDDVSVPIFIIEGANDEDIEGNPGKELYDLARAPKEFWLAPTGHDVFADAPEEYEQKVLEFISGQVNSGG